MKREPPINSVGKKYGMLTVVELTGDTNARGEKYVRCICDCGNEKVCMLRLVRRGSISACGCTKREASVINIAHARKRAEEIGYFKSPLLRSQQMVFRKRYSDGNLTFDEFIKLSQQDCYYCGCKPSNKTTTYHSKDISKERLDKSFFVYNGLDRVDNSRGHDRDNVVPCCRTCNTAKLKTSQDKFFSWIKLVYEKHYLENGLQTSALAP